MSGQCLFSPCAPLTCRSCGCPGPELVHEADPLGQALAELREVALVPFVLARAEASRWEPRRCPPRRAPAVITADVDLIERWRR